MCLRSTTPVRLCLELGVNDIHGADQEADVKFPRRQDVPRSGETA